MNKIIVENDTMRFYSTPVPIPVGGSQWSKIFFMFSDEWEDLRKIAQFRQGELKRNVDIDSNNFCYVPNEMLPDMCGELSIVGYPQDTSSAVIATANSLMLNFVQGFESGGEPAVPPTPDLYQKLIKEFVEKQQSDWNQNGEDAQDYIKNRTHWKEEKIEKYEKLKLTSFLQDGRVHFYSLGGQIRFGGEPDLSVYPFSLRYGGDPIYSDKIPLTTLYLTSLAYTSCSGMSVYDEKEQLIGHFRFDALTFTAANDMYYTTVLLEVPYDYDVVYTVVLETKPVYHKIPQEYLNTYIFELEQDKNGNSVSPFSSDEIEEMAENGTHVICRNTAPGVCADYHFVATFPLDDGIVAIFVSGMGPTQQIIEINHNKHVNMQMFDLVSRNDLADYQTRSIEDSEKYFGEDPTVEGALKQVWKGKQCLLKKNASDEYQIMDWNNNIIQPNQVPDNAVILYNNQLYYPYSSSTELCFMSISFTHCSRIVLNRRYNIIEYYSCDNFTLPRPVQRTSDMTQPVGVDYYGKLWTAPAPTITLRTWADIEEPI